MYRGRVRRHLVCCPKTAPAPPETHATRTSRRAAPCPSFLVLASLRIFQVFVGTSRPRSVPITAGVHWCAFRRARGGRLRVDRVQARRHLVVDRVARTFGDVAAVTVDIELVQKPFVDAQFALQDRKSTRLNSSHMSISYAVFCLKKK